MAVAMAILTSGCSLALTTPAPTTPAAPSSDASTPSPTHLLSLEPDPTPPLGGTDAPTTVPTTEPTIEPPPTQTPSSTPVQEPPSDSTWRAAGDFPPAGATINDVEYGSQLVIGGSVPDPSAACPDRTSARIWTPLDDGDWFEAIHDVTRNASVDAVAEPHGWDALGRDGSVGCPGEGVAQFSPTDKADWYRMDVTGFDPNDDLTDVVWLEPSYHFVATGSYADDDSHMGVWISDDDLGDGFWRRAHEPPPQRTTETLYSLATLGDLVVGFDGTSTIPAWYSPDTGETWRNAGFQPSYRFRPVDSIAALGQIYAAGTACCTLPGVDVGVVLRTDDGNAWERVGPAFVPPIDDIAAMASGIIAVAGEQTFLSRDGTTWQEGPRLPAYTPGERLFVAAKRDNIVVVSSRHVWFADADDLDPGRWPDAAPHADLPAVGDSFDYELFTHCGPNGALRFGLRLWVPEDDSLVDGDFPPSFEDLEPGRLTFAARNRLEFTGRSGDVVVYEPTDSPPESFPCA